MLPSANANVLGCRRGGCVFGKTALSLVASAMEITIPRSVKLPVRHKLPLAAHSSSMINFHGYASWDQDNNGDYKEATQKRDEQHWIASLVHVEQG
jgi:hypothetical protein